jgi:hypothetical protein
VLVLVVPPQPEDLLTLLVAADRCAVQQAAVPHRRFETAGGGQVGPVDVQAVAKGNSRCTPGPDRRPDTRFNT